MESEEGEDRKHDDDKADEINDTVHGGNLLHCLTNLPGANKFHHFQLISDSEATGEPGELSWKFPRAVCRDADPAGRAEIGPPLRIGFQGLRLG